MRILTEPKNALVKQYARLFEMEGVELELRDDAMRCIAHKAMERKTGARGLRTIMEQVLLDTMYDLPSMKNVCKVVVDGSVIIGREPALPDLRGSRKAGRLRGMTAGLPPGFARAGRARRCRSPGVAPAPLQAIQSRPVELGRVARPDSLSLFQLRISRPPRRLPLQARPGSLGWPAPVRVVIPRAFQHRECQWHRKESSRSPAPRPQQEVPVLPLRDVVVYPHMVIPLFVGPRQVDPRPRRRHGQRQADPAGRPEERRRGRPGRQGPPQIGTLANILQLLKLPDGTVKVLVEGNQRARIDALSDHRRGLLRPASSPLPETLEADEREQEVLIRSAVSPLRPVRQAQQEGPARGADLARQHRRGRAAGRHHGRAHVAQARREAARPGDDGHPGAPRAPDGPHGVGERHPADGEAHPRAGQAPDGEEPARVLPQRADEGDPEGTGRARGGAQRDRGTGQARSRTRGCPRRSRPRHQPS